METSLRTEPWPVGAVLEALTKLFGDNFLADVTAAIETLQCDRARFNYSKPRPSGLLGLGRDAVIVRALDNPLEPAVRSLCAL